MGMKARNQSMAVLASRLTPRAQVDPFGLFPCPCDALIVHTTTGASLGDDLLECRVHGVSATLHDLFAHLWPGSAASSSAG